MTARLEHLCSPVRIGQLTLKNRMVVSAMGTNLAEEDGSCGQRLVDFHARQARGGAGLIILGTTGVSWPAGTSQPRQIGISEDYMLPSLRRLTDAVHVEGGKIAAQLHHAGLMAANDRDQGRPMWVPSIPVVKQGDMQDGFLPEELNNRFGEAAPLPRLHVMTEADIQLLVSQFARGAGRAKAAGMDGIEIHAGHGYILSGFLSPLMNQRDDAYGGSLENRARLLLEIIAAIRTEVGSEFPLWCKIDSAEFGQADGISLPDAIATARLLEAAGVDAITVSAFHDGSQGVMQSESNIPQVPERMVDNAIAIKRSISLPVITAGRIEPDSANRHIAQGHFDLLAMGRKLLADPDLPRKISEGRPEDVRPCVYCYCCVSQIYIQKSIKCAVNPETAFEGSRSLVATSRSRHFAVVGGGPAGMEAARRLADSGHRVTLLEAGDRLGGTLQFAAIAYSPNERLLHWLRRSIAQSSVQVQFNTRVTPELLTELGADEVVVATGARRDLPPIPGADQAFVFSGEEMRAMVLGESRPGLRYKLPPLTSHLLRLSAASGISRSPALLRRLSHAWLPLGRELVIIGAELVGLELAEFLAHRGRRVSVIDTAPRPGAGLYVVRRMRLLHELRALGVVLINAAEDIRIGDRQVQYRNYRGQTRTLDAPQVVVATGATGDDSLAQQLRQSGLPVHAIGDCTGVGYIEGAMEAAAELVATRAR